MNEDSTRTREPHSVAVDVDLGAAAALAVDTYRAAPAAVVAAARRTDGAWRFGAGAAGKLTWEAASAPATIETPFDLASLTKPVTALTLARLHRACVLDRSEPLGDVVPWLNMTISSDISLDLLSAHRAGLEAHRAFFAPLVEGRTVGARALLCEAAGARRSDCRGAIGDDGFPPVYSDLGYLLLGAAIVERTGDELDRVLTREVIEPLCLRLGSARALAQLIPDFEDRVAPTEVVAFRGGLVRGVVHDENALALSGHGAAGHAGLFGDAVSVAELGVAVLDALSGRSAAWLDANDLEPLVRTRPGGSLLAGFDRRSGETPTSGSLFGPRTFGHLGFTGTSLWIDPDAELVGVLLTNRVHPSREALAIRAARPAVYDAMAAAMFDAPTSADADACERA